MTRRKGILAAVGLLIASAAAGAAYLWRAPDVPAVAAEALRRRDLDALVSASGKIQPKRQVNVSANTMGRVPRLAVQEGERVRAGQFLLEIDPRSLEGQLQRGEANVAAARSSLEQSRTTVDQARATLELARQNLKRQDELWKDGLTTRESLERAQSDVTVREAELRTRQQEIQTREEQIKQEQASLATTRYPLSQVIIASPMDGIVTRRNIEEGENVMVGTMNNAGTVLLTIADMSVVEAEVEVDETDIPTVTLGQEARITIDAVPDRTFRGRVTEIGNSPIQSTGAAATTSRQATNFKVVVVVDEPIPDVRPGFTCPADITTATRTTVTAVPIPAVAVRELVFDATGAIVKPPRDPKRRPGAPSPPPPAVELQPGQTRKETEGVFVLRRGAVEYVPITMGIAGDRYFEVLSGLAPGDEVVIGPYNTVRTLLDGDKVRTEAEAGAR
mgnify:CR=1 FL=1